MLKSSLLIILILNIFTKDIYKIGGIFLILSCLNLIYNKNLKKNIRNVKIIIIIYMITCITQIFYLQEGKVLYKFYNIYITQEGIVNFLRNYVRVINLIMISWLVSVFKIVDGRYTKYHKIIEKVMLLVPEVFVIIKKPMKIKWFFRYILKQIKVKK